MRAVVFLEVLWTMPFLYFGWRAWATWPSKEEHERQREVSELYDHHFEKRRANPPVTVLCSLSEQDGPDGKQFPENVSWIL